MIRTQIHLTDEQSRRLHEEAARAGCSVAELVRRSIDRFLEVDTDVPSAEGRRAAAARVTGLFRSMRADVAARHDGDLDDVWSN